MGKQGNRGGNGRTKTTSATDTTALALIKIEKTWTDYIDRYLKERERRLKIVDTLLIIMVCVYIAIAAAIFWEIYDVRRMNAEFIQMKEEATREMVKQYQESVNNYNKSIEGWRNGKQAEK